MKKQIPRFATDEEAERFIDESDLTEYDLSGFVPATVLFVLETQSVTLSIPGRLLDAVRRRAQAQGMPAEAFMREALEAAVNA